MADTFRKTDSGYLNFYMITLNKQHRRYEKYQDAGVQWLDTIPQEWKMLRNQSQFNVVRNIVNEHSGDFVLLSLTLKGIIPRDVESGKGKFPESFDSYQKVKKGDLVFCLFDIDETPRTIGLSSLDGMVTGAYTVVRCLKNTCPKYLYYYYLSLDFQKGLRPLYTGLRKVIRPNTFLHVKMPIPSFEEQSFIASYLDEKCALIDILIAKKQRQIELLQEQRAAIINRAVTKGLDEGAEMKESGVEWIGKIPKGWDIKKLKTAFGFEKGKQSGMFTKEFVSDPSNEGEYPVYSGQTEDEGVMGRINSYIYDLDDTIFTTTVGVKVMTPMIIGGKFSLSQNCVLFMKKTRNMDIRYFYYQLFPMFKWEKDSIPSHMQPSLRVSDLNKYSVAFPKYEEQVRIANYIEEKTKFIDRFLNAIEISILLLSEYKTSLISHAVTGRIKVS